MADGQTKKIIEALIFASPEPLKEQQIKDILEVQGVDTKLINEILTQLKQEYETADRGFKLLEIAGGWQFMTDAACAEWVKRLSKTTTKERLSKPALETLAIIAYRQPLTRADIEYIRGVSIEGLIKNLLDKNLIRIIGRKEVIGRPFLYGTTSHFLNYFGLNSLAELPKLPEFSEAEIKLEQQIMIPKEEEKENEPKEIA